MLQQQVISANPITGCLILFSHVCAQSAIGFLSRRPFLCAGVVVVLVRGYMCNGVTTPYN